MENKILHYCHIKNQNVAFDGEVLFQNSSTLDFQKFIKGVYKHFGFDYPKFYKMDSLCKLSLMAGSILLDKMPEAINPDTAILLSNKSSCLDIDRKHQATLTEGEGYVSPANFVYTLPNIAIGEISIKYKLRSEHSFFIFENFKPGFLIDYANSLINFEQSKAAFCGWAEVFENDYNALFFLIKPERKEAFKKTDLVNLI